MAELLTAISEISTLYLQCFDTHSPSVSLRLSLFLPLARFLADIKTSQWIISKHKRKHLLHLFTFYTQAAELFLQFLKVFFFLYDCFICDIKLVLIAII